MPKYELWWFRVLLLWNKNSQCICRIDPDEKWHSFPRRGFYSWQHSYHIQNWLQYSSHGVANTEQNVILVWLFTKSRGQSNTVKKQWKTCPRAAALWAQVIFVKTSQPSPNPHTVNPHKQSTQETLRKVILILRSPAWKGRETLCYSNYRHETSLTDFDQAIPVSSTTKMIKFSMDSMLRWIS